MSNGAFYAFDKRPDHEANRSSLFFFLREREAIPLGITKFV